MTSTSRRGPWRAVFWVAVVVFCLAMAALGMIVYTYWAGQNAYDQLQDVAFADEDAKTSMTVDWDALRAVNPEVCGWIIVPGTTIDYPIVHRDGDDEYYLSHDFNGNENGVGPDYGCIMLAGANNPDWSDQVNLCYGHNLLNGKMFSPFNTLREDEAFNSHRTIYLLTPEVSWELETFAMNKVHGTDPTIAVQNFPTAEALAGYIQSRIDESIVTPDPPAPPAASIHKVFEFSTCNPEDNQWRTVTFASIKKTLTALPDEASSPQFETYATPGDA